MTTKTNLSYHLAQLSLLLNKAGSDLDRMLIVVPGAQTGHEILSSLTLHGSAWVNVRASTLSRYARQVVEEAGPDISYRFVSQAGMALSIEKILLESTSKDAGILRRSSRSVAGTIRDLRLGGVSAESFERLVTSRFAQFVSGVYRDYLDWLEVENLLDEASVLVEATRLTVTKGVLRPPEVLAVLDEVSLPDLALTFVEAVAKDVSKVWRIGWDASGTQPPGLTAASRLSRWSIPVGRSGSIGSADGFETGVEILTGTGAENEVRAVFRSVVSNEIPFDSVELAYVANDPYLKIIRSLSSRYDIDVTFAAGVPALDTVTGQALRAFLGWIQEGLPSAGLVSMLRGSLVQLRTAKSEGGADLSRDAADVLGRIRVGRGKDGYAPALEFLLDESITEAERAADTFASGEAELNVAQIRSVAEMLEPLLELADLPQRLTVVSLLQCLSQFILKFRPVSHTYDITLVSAEARRHDVVEAEDDSGEESEDPLHDLEQKACRDLLTRFRQLADQIEGQIPLQSLIRHGQDLIAEAFVQARAARAGAIHVVPLSSAAFTGRPNLFVVGLDEQTTGRMVSEDPLLSDEEREILARSGAGRLPVSEYAVGKDSWYLARARARATGRTTLLYSNYSVSEDRELFPSSALLRIMSSRGEVTDRLPVHSYDRGGTDFIPLDRTDVFLASRMDSLASARSIEPYPGLMRGRRAATERQSSAWSVFDGLLGIETEKLNPYRKKTRISASRLETLVKCPFQYFLKYVLRARLPEELDDMVWMNALQRGSLVHDGLRRFMAERKESGERVTESDAGRLIDVFDEELSAIMERNPPPNPAEKDALDSELRSVAEAFIVDELSRQDFADPFGFEFGFGLWRHRKKRDTDRTDIVTVDVDGVEFRIWGWIDRIDRLKGGGFLVTDYKTGSSAGYDEADLLSEGRTLQWALYAFVVESLLGEPVRSSGYLFPGSREMGKRLEGDPSLVRSGVADVLRRVGRMARAGVFIQTANPKGMCQWCDYRRVCGNLVERSQFIDAKLEATGPANAEYELLQGWDFAARKLGGKA